jgi:hypothetical protein
MAKREIDTVLADMHLEDVVFVETKKPREAVLKRVQEDVVFVETKKPRATVRAPDTAVQEVLVESESVILEAAEAVVEADRIYTFGKEGRCRCGFEGVCMRVTAFNCVRADQRVSTCPVWVGTIVCRQCAPRVEREAVCPECAGASRL